MAPRKGGGSSGSGSGSSSGGLSSCPADADWPCTSELHFMYGDHYSSWYSEGELYAQIVLYSIWTLALVAIFLQAYKHKARWLQTTTFLFFAAFVFVVVRLALIIAQSYVAIGYRFESSIVVLLERLGSIALFAAIFAADARTWLKLVFYPLLFVYACLNIAYLALDFAVSTSALAAYKESWSWWIADRDFGLTLSSQAKDALTKNGPFWLNPSYVFSRMYGGLGQPFHVQRGAQIKVGVAADFMALGLSVLLLVVAVLGSRKRTRGTIWLLAASLLVLLSSFFKIIVSTHYVMHNWTIISDLRRWDQWVDGNYIFDNSNGLVISGPDGFLDGYRPTVAGFHALQAVFVPLGIVGAAQAVAVWWRFRREEERERERAGLDGRAEK